MARTQLPGGHHSSRIGGFAEHQGSTKLTPRGRPIHATESERKSFETGFKSMPQGFAATLDRFADCLTKACIFGAYARLLTRWRMSESGQRIPKIAQREA